MMIDDKLFRVAICYEEGIVLQIRAKNGKEAEKKAYELADELGGSSYPKEYKQKSVHRNYFSQDAEEIK